MPQHTIFRILGDESPPRDTPGRRIETLQWILANEPKFPDCHCWWVVNVAADESLQQQYVAALSQARASFTVRTRDWRHYPCDSPIAERAGFIIDINGTRNACIEHGQRVSRYTFVLDGDCFFLQQDWDAVVQGIAGNQNGPEPVQYFSLPTRRVSAQDPTRFLEPTTTEPMLGLRYDATQRFDTRIPFGTGDKQEFLWRLGYDPEARRPYRQLNTVQCVEIGIVRHYANGDDAAEQQTSLRGRLRKQSLQNLVDRVETQLGLL